MRSLSRAIWKKARDGTQHSSKIPQTFFQEAKQYVTASSEQSNLACLDPKAIGETISKSFPSLMRTDRRNRQGEREHHCPWSLKVVQHRTGDTYLIFVQLRDGKSAPGASPSDHQPVRTDAETLEGTTRCAVSAKAQCSAANKFSHLRRTKITLVRHLKCMG